MPKITSKMRVFPSKDDQLMQFFTTNTCQQPILLNGLSSNNNNNKDLQKTYTESGE